ncbi:glutathione peroxidase [Janthinobacterium sp. HLX7-2]|uniref:glutathione peroxidase n=1 Tax=Janthinobacterium sp. HLX7-2 TaxID=1259331 RepID=UPI003F28EAA6
MASIHDFQATALDGTPIDLAQYAGKVLLIVNTASACGFTPQYRGLEALYQQFQQQGLVVLGFPCNQFRQQEPGSNAEIGAFCAKNFGVTFPLFAKIEVNGPHTHPLFAQLKQAAPGILGTQSIKWNFTKFLVRKDGSVFRRYATASKPATLTDDIARLLQA